MTSVHPTPRTWTVRFKNSCTTVLLHCDPLQTLSSLKLDLLDAIQQTHPDGIINGHTVPQNSQYIAIGRPVDINDLSQGWQNLEEDALFYDDADSKGKGKAKIGPKGNGKGKGLESRGCIKDLGFKDGGMLAFKFVAAMDEAGISAADVDDVGDCVIVAHEALEEWDVKIPTMEDTYAENEDVEVEGGRLPERAIG